MAVKQRTPSLDLQQVEPSPCGSVPGVYDGFMWKNIFVAFWVGPVTVPSVASFEKLCVRWREEFPQGISSVHILSSGHSHLPTTEARTELGRVSNQYSDVMAASAVIIPGSGFWASAIRGIVTALRMVIERPVELRICSDVEAVSEWLPPLHAKRTGVAVTPEELLRVLRYAQRSQQAQSR